MLIERYHYKDKEGRATSLDIRQEQHKLFAVYSGLDRVSIHRLLGDARIRCHWEAQLFGLTIVKTTNKEEAS